MTLEELKALAYVETFKGKTFTAPSKSGNSKPCFYGHTRQNWEGGSAISVVESMTPMSSPDMRDSSDERKRIVESLNLLSKLSTQDRRTKPVCEKPVCVKAPALSIKVWNAIRQQLANIL